VWFGLGNQRLCWFGTHVYIYSGYGWCLHTYIQGRPKVLYTIGVPATIFAKRSTSNYWWQEGDDLSTPNFELIIQLHDILHMLINIFYIYNMDLGLDLYATLVDKI
jgi:hypothetical protein